MAIPILMMGARLKATPPAIMAEWLLGDPEKKPFVLFPVMAMWGALFGLSTYYAFVTADYAGGLAFALVPWLALNLMMLPLAGAGFFGLKRWKMIPVLSLAMHLAWGLVAATVFVALAAVAG